VKAIGTDYANQHFSDWPAGENKMAEGKYHHGFE
jgi:hypothetical protein